MKKVRKQERKHFYGNFIKKIDVKKFPFVQNFFFWDEIKNGNGKD